MLRKGNIYSTDVLALQSSDAELEELSAEMTRVVTEQV